MKELITIEKNETTDCDVVINRFEHTLLNLENCFETVVDDKKTKMNVVGSIFGFGFSLTKLTFSVAGCVLKNTPKAVVAVAAVKRDIIDSVTQEWNQFKKEQQEEALNEKIKQLTLKR
jgi:hypothetical protein